MKLPDSSKVFMHWLLEQHLKGLNPAGTLMAIGLMYVVEILRNKGIIL